MERSEAKNKRKAAYSTAITATQGAAISPAKLTKVSPAADIANRLVRFDTGSSSEPALARWVQAYACGFGRTPILDAVANTTGVSSTTVASSDRTAVTAEASTKTKTSSRWASPLALGGHQGAGVAEQAVGVAELADHQHGGQEGHHREQVLDLGPGLVPAEGAGEQHDQGGGYGGHRLGQPAGPDHGEAEHHDQHRNRDHLAHGRSP